MNKTSLAHDQSIKTGNEYDPTYDAVRSAMQSALDDAFASGPVFKTDASGLWDLYLAAFPDSDRQYHNCNTCSSFFRQYASLARVTSDGAIVSVFDGVGVGEYSEPWQAVSRAVSRARIVEPFVCQTATIGNGQTGSWSHYTCKIPASHVWASRIQTAHQRACEKSEDFNNIQRALSEFSKKIIDQALAIINSDALYRSEKVKGPAEFLAKIADPKIRKNRNLLWVEVAKAPAGFCHPRSSMVGTLLEDIESGKPLDRVASSFAAKMHPLQYMRPTAAPNEGAIKRAEEIFHKLGLAPSLRRRFARIDDIQAIWTPNASESQKSPGIFGHLRAHQESPSGSLPPVVMTFSKFRDKILPSAEYIEVHVPSLGNFFQFVAQADPSAPQILRWDNGVSVYTYTGGSRAEAFGLRAGFAKCVAVTLDPSMWGDSKVHGRDERAFFIIDGARETRSSGLALFPEILRGDLHEVRSVIEAHSRTGKIEGMGEPSVAGLTFPLTVRVKSGVIASEYKIDRWD